MTTFDWIREKCAVCGAEGRYAVISSTNSFGSPDLDLRPSEMARSTMGFWVHKCPECGYVSASVSDERGIPLEFLQSEEYTGCDGLSFQSALAVKFYKQYKCLEYEKDMTKAFYALLHCVWACDDEGDSGNAKTCREHAASLLADVIRNSDDEEQNENRTLLKADLLRRSGHFDEVVAELGSVEFSEDGLKKIADFQIARAKEKDTGCYRVSDTDDEYSPPYVISV